MRVIFVYPICWSLFWVGHVISLVLRLSPDREEPSRFWMALADAYQRTMGPSYRLQVWAEAGTYSHVLPWRAPK